MRRELSAQRLRDLFRYEPKSGEFTRLARISSNTHVGQVAGNVAIHGYLTIRVDGRLYYAHRLAFLYMTGAWPKNHVDHKNLVKSDNSWENLRECTRSQNNGNVAARKTNRSGLKGAYYKRDRRKWYSQIQINGSVHCLGYFPSAQSAHEAYTKAAELHYGEFARAS